MSKQHFEDMREREPYTEAELIYIHFKQLEIEHEYQTLKNKTK